MSLTTLWFIIVAIFWVGFFVLEGFDFGVGMLHSFVGRTDTEQARRDQHDRPVLGRQRGVADRGRRGDLRRVPRLVRHHVLGLLPRPAARARRADGPRRVVRVPRQDRGSAPARRSWTWCTTIGSVLIPLLLGVGLGDLLAGLPIDKNDEFTGNFFDLLTPYGLWTGLTLVGLCLLHGATFLTLQDDRRRARPRARVRRGRSAGSRSRWSSASSSGPGPCTATRRSRRRSRPGAHRRDLRRAPGGRPRITRAGRSPRRRSRSPRSSARSSSTSTRT